MDHWGVRVLELLVTPSGAAITLFLVVFVLTLCVFFVRSAREMVREVFTRGMRGRWRDAEIQFGTVETPRPDAPDLTGNVSPAQPGKPESVVPTALPAPAAQEGSEHSGGDDEISMTFRMYEAAFSRDRQALDRAYSDLERLAGRQTTDETLVTLRAELEYRIDREMGLKKLKHVASIHKTWYEPCYKIADIYVDLDQYELAAKWLDEAERRTKDEIDHVRSSLIRAKILIGAESEMRALKYLQEKLEEFSCNENKASLWVEISELYHKVNENERSLMALEMAVRLDPLKLDYRFNLAFQYAQDKSTALLAFYHYKKLVNQDRKHPSALNNFALLVNELRMPATHVSMLSQAKSFESPYPHGNLSIRLAEAGFLESALEVLEELPPDKRLETRAVDAANFIRRKRVEEEKRFERIVDDSEMLQNIYFKAAESMHSPRVLNSILGEWEGTSGERLSLDETAGPDRLDGTLTRGSSNYDLRLRAVGSLLTGTARTKSAGLMTQWEEIINLVVESNRRLEGVIGRDELGLKKVKFNRV